MQWFSIAATSAVISAFVAALGTLLNAHLQRKAEEQRRLEELAMRMAISEWEVHIRQTDREGGTTQPPEKYLLRYCKLLPLICRNKLTAERLVEIERELDLINRTPPQ